MQLTDDLIFFSWELVTFHIHYLPIKIASGIEKY